MRHALCLFWSNLVCDYRQTTIQLHGIAIDDLAVEITRYLNRQLPAVISFVTRESTLLHTSDLPVPVAPTMAIKGLSGARAMLFVLRDLIDRIIRLSYTRVAVRRADILG